MPSYTVPDELDGARIDKFLAMLMSNAVSRVQIQRTLKAGGVLDADGIPVANNSMRVSAGQEYSIEIIEAVETPAMPENIPLDILYEDDDVIIVNKPAGMVVHSGAGVTSGTLVNALLYHTKLSSIGAGAGRPGIVHRLDKDTSGAMMACKTDEAHIEMYKKFEKHAVSRDYIALAWGMPPVPADKISANIARDPRNYQRFVTTSAGGKNAITHYETMKVFTGVGFRPLTLLKLSLETGRTHQIRVHLESIGHPIVGDATYAGRLNMLNTIENKELRMKIIGIKRQMLHSKNIEFTHPRTGKQVTIETEIPRDMRDIIDFLTKIT